MMGNMNTMSYGEWIEWVNKTYHSNPVLEAVFNKLTDDWRYERDLLQRKLDLAMKALNEMPHTTWYDDSNYHHNKNNSCPGCIADKAEAEIAALDSGKGGEG